MLVDDEATIVALYAAAMGTDDWSSALEKLAQLTGTRAITIDTYDVLTHAGTVLATNIAPQLSVEDYKRQFGHSNPFIEISLPQLLEGAVYRASDLVDDRIFFNSDLYNLAYRPLGLKHVMSLFLDVSAGSTLQYTVSKADDAPDFSDRELAVFNCLKPHLIQSWQGYQHLHATRMNLQTLTEFWDCFRHAVFVLDDRAQLHFANRAGETLLRRRALACVEKDRFSMLDAGADQLLRRSLGALKSEQRRVQSLSLPSARVTLYRLGEDRLALLITDPAHSQDRIQGLRRVYRLSPAEANLVNALAQGRSLRQYAADQGISYETARTHLKHAMHQNGWHRQSDMIATVLRRLLPENLLFP